ncbi:uncharacterized protein B0T23DRAFT_407316 [Neurospora hispaniola]|uniref:Uncharacterized protein n=1 Tax=Neurospora hispaniola TaxID=588809 RepID=A0AAJ0I355_9PEZI|nr:hypothetical protein B0T23DRAFT_407316 [Neurospora hispaniola]
MSLRVQGTMAYTSSSSENSLLNKLAWSRKNKFLGQLHRSMTSKFSSPPDRDSSTGGGQQAAFSSPSARQSRDGAASHAGRPRPSTATSRGGFASDERSTQDGMTDYMYEEDADEEAEEARHGSKSGSDIEVDDITDAPRSPKSTPNINKSPERPPPPPPKHKKKTLPEDPAYVAPIGKIGPIGSIPKIPSRSNSEKGGISVSPSSRPQLPPYIGSYLKGKTVDEYGDIIDPQTGTILAHAGGDLPSIVGRQVSNDQGDILGDEGELLGYVADVEVGKKTASPEEAAPKPMMSLAEVMSRNNTAWMVDHDGNILDAQGNVVGMFLDHNNPGERGGRGVPVPHYEEADKDEKEGAAEEEPQREQSRPPRRTEEERRANAAAWRKENPGESPSDIFLDVKSTTEGIQLTIRIPTVFGNGQQLKPNISFS